MGRDVTLYPKKASRRELREYLESLGFHKCGHFWDWPKGTLNYSWFERQDFKSIDGVSADIFPTSPDEKKLQEMIGPYTCATYIARAGTM